MWWKLFGKKLINWVFQLAENIGKSQHYQSWKRQDKLFIRTKYHLIVCLAPSLGSVLFPGMYLNCLLLC